MRINLRKKKPLTERRSSKTVDEYICINGKKLSEQTINDYAQFIPKWSDRIELGDECYLVSCVQPHNHTHGDDPIKGGTPSMLISTGSTVKYE